MIACPNCKTPVQPDWDWCHACGWDPEGLRPAGVGPVQPPGYGAPPGYGPAPRYGAPPPSGRGVGRIVVVVAVAVVGLIVVGAVAVFALAEPTPSAAPTSSTASTAMPAGDVGKATGGPWVPWTATDGSFTIEFPEAPVVEPVPTEDSPYATSEQAIADLGKSVYAAFYFELVPGYAITDTNGALSGVVEAMGGSAGITFSSRTPGTFGFLPSLAFTGSVDGGEGTVQGMAVVSERRLFVMFTISFDQVLVDYDRFVGSFKAG
jgi:hypothetical protein